MGPCANRQGPRRDGGWRKGGGPLPGHPGVNDFSEPHLQPLTVRTLISASPSSEGTPDTEGGPSAGRGAHGTDTVTAPPCRRALAAGLGEVGTGHRETGYGRDVSCSSVWPGASPPGVETVSPPLKMDRLWLPRAIETQVTGVTVMEGDAAASG